MPLTLAAEAHYDPDHHLRGHRSGHGNSALSDRSSGWCNGQRLSPREKRWVDGVLEYTISILGVLIWYGGGWFPQYIQVRTMFA